MKLLTLALIIALAGCQQLGELPSLQYCEHVSYERTERNMHIEADCVMPYGRI